MCKICNFKSFQTYMTFFLLRYTKRDLYDIFIIGKMKTSKQFPNLTRGKMSKCLEWRHTLSELQACFLQRFFKL